nr:MAG TPA: hypothetical protein [Caudoviricetes sp.]
MRLLNSTYFFKSSLRLRWTSELSFRTDYPSGSCLPTLCSRCTVSLLSGRLLIAHYKYRLALVVPSFYLSVRHPYLCFCFSAPILLYRRYGS